MREGPYRVLLADDHPLVRKAIRRLIETDPALLVTGETSSLKQAMRALRRKPVDLLIMDLVFPREDGLAFIAEVRRAFPRLGILVASLHRESLFAEPVLRAGANGFIMKSNAPAELAAAARAVLERRFYVSPMMRALLRERKGTAGGTQLSPALTGVPICGPPLRQVRRRSKPRRTHNSAR
ncbi:MAG: response regulator transcription factor [Kiritimatiellae bacterium]|nr:response regulator transcription factor [Kiritimatiellia bacterium]MDW8457722.1 response regulator transcription factor [Verrucomicrobiota bacterium]